MLNGGDRIGALLATVFLVVMFGLDAFVPSSVKPPQGQTYEQSYYDAENSPSKVVIAEGPDDRIADYTGWLAAFTLALVVVSFFQIYFLIRADKATRASVELARNEFNTAHRPKIIVRNFQFSSPTISAGNAVDVIFTAQNIGDTAGKVIEVRSGTIVLDAQEKMPTDLSFPFHETFDYTLASGAREIFPANGSAIITEGQPFQIFEGIKFLYCLGTIAYVDAGSTRRETGFCRRFISKERRWERVESEYEYEY